MQNIHLRTPQLQSLPIARVRRKVVVYAFLFPLSTAIAAAIRAACVAASDPPAMLGCLRGGVGRALAGVMGLMNWMVRPGPASLGRGVMAGDDVVEPWP